MKNQNGYILITAIMLLALISLLGITAMKQVTNELQVVNNRNIYQRSFWNAESGVVVGISGLPEMLTAAGQVNTPTLGWEGYLTRTDSPPFYTVWINHKLKSGEVVYYGDIDNDYILEYNTSQIGWPVEIVTSKGTDYQGGNVGVEVEATYVEIFPDPKSAIWVGGDVNSNGVAGQIHGEGPPGNEWECPNKADILFNDPAATIDYGGDLGFTPIINQDPNIYPYPLIKSALLNKASRLIEPKYIDDTLGTESDPGIYYAPGNLEIVSSMGFGVLMVDGDLELKGNIEWEGIIIVNGNFRFSGGGNKAVYGSIIVMGDVVRLDGGIDIFYDCTSLLTLKDTFSSYRRVSWKQL